MATSASTKMPKIVFGAAGIGNRGAFKNPSDLDPLFKALTAHNISTIDTAQLYGESEAALGSASAGKTFTLDTKWFGGWKPGSATHQSVVSSAKNSIGTLNVPKVDIFYLHAHDPDTPLSDTLAGVNEAYNLGLFERFGLSNYLASTTQEVYSICKANNYVLPTVYQVNYSAVTRLPEDELFPLLRKLGIAIYAYSPIAGGLLAKTRKQIEDGVSRFSTEGSGSLYSRLYNKPSYLEMLDKWGAIAEEAGCSKAELAYRWVAYHSVLKAEDGDGIIIGASSLGQVEKTMEGLERGALPEKVTRKIEELWDSVKAEAPVDNFNL